MADLTSVRPETISIRFSDGSVKEMKFTEITVKKTREEMEKVLNQAISLVEKAKLHCYRV